MPSFHSEQVGERLCFEFTLISWVNEATIQMVIITIAILGAILCILLVQMFNFVCLQVPKLITFVYIS